MLRVVNTTDTVHGTAVNVTCPVHQSFGGGTPKMTETVCGKNGHWNPVVPTCVTGMYLSTQLIIKAEQEQLDGRYRTSGGKYAGTS